MYMYTYDLIFFFMSEYSIMLTIISRVKDFSVEKWILKRIGFLKSIQTLDYKNVLIK